MVRLSVIVLITSITALYYSACGARVDTGRNQNPNEWPRDEGSNQNGPGTISSPTSGRSPNESPETNGSPIAGSCFRTEASVLMPALQKLCDENIKINPLLAKIHEYLCVKKFLLSALHQKSCGWHGDPTSLMRHISIYEREPETSGRDYEDVHATILNPPVAAPVYLNFMRLAFENYSEFKRQGFQWISGTRESTNLNQGTLESGVKYKFRVDREAYELGYSGILIMPMVISSGYGSLPKWRFMLNKKTAQ
ncbi:MAG: hypothetical protein NTV34_15440 [Proteobacteria bacterium]|nr:hypothetical protein [Pseudomonadota bacterium]